MKGLNDLMPHDESEPKPADGNGGYNASANTAYSAAPSALDALKAKENELYTEIGRQVVAQSGPDGYGELSDQLKSVLSQIQGEEQRIREEELARQAAIEAERARQAELEAERVRQAELEAERARQAELEAERARQAASAAVPPASQSACPQCGTQVTVGVKFCPECGTRIPEAPQKKFCPGCGTEVTPETKFCGSCGTKTGA
jgi:RNA polymerase subunit RPABC4/transcription elongation factor Spt4